MLAHAVACAVLGLASTATARHSDHGSASHKALVDLLGTALLESTTLLSSPDPECNKTCTPTWGGTFSDDFDGCTGVYEKVCRSTNAKHLYSRTVCEGLWYDKDKGKNGTDSSEAGSSYVACEGAFSYFLKGVHNAHKSNDSQAASSSPVAILTAEPGARRPPTAFAVGYGCLGKLVTMKTETDARYTSCDQASGSFIAGKALPAGEPLPASQTAALLEAEDIANHQSMDFFKGAPPGARPAPPARPEHHHEHHHGDHDHHHDDHDHHHGDHDHNDHGDHHDRPCQVTCNGKPLKLWGLLPCWGTLEVACSSDRGTLTATCKGTTWPLLGSCNGLYSASAADDKGTMYAVTAGKHKVGPIHSPHPGWKGFFEMSRGRASSFASGRSNNTKAGAGLGGLHLSDLSAERLSELNPAGLLTQLGSA